MNTDRPSERAGGFCIDFWNFSSSGYLAIVEEDVAQDVGIVKVNILSTVT